eukprot:CAMPEP_0168418984 /NCGR_PEP_ID=MMETSP0228-20121227/32039_1 /TAXON_ID=133427 /ORGANISM="Protoceratium reticulatum, Strain CCCM 535 (=CCMP 1889)" /LENGTH=395 /DNA_ID=CAMNT_0008432861 /DNA_START=26 /DNA_END=1213 /DNA_ORIENTATION=+
MGAVCSSEATAGKPSVEAVVPDAEPVEPEAQKPEEPAPPPEPKLTVAIVAARGLRDLDWLPGAGLSDAFCVLTVNGAEVGRTQVQNDSLEPVWKEEFEVLDWEAGQELSFGVFDADLARNQSLGQALLPSDLFTKAGFNGEIKLNEAGEGIDAYLKVKVKLHKQDYPRGPPAEIEIKVEKDPTQKLLGLDLDPNDGKTLYVTEVKAGPFKSYNEGTPQGASGAPPERQIQKGDFIIKVNGIKNDSEKMLGALKKDTSIELTLKRPMEITAALKRSDPKQPLGLDFYRPVGISSVLVTAVQSSGPAAAWNKANWSQELLVGDRVVAVRGQRGSGKDLLNLLKEEADDAAAPSGCCAPKRKPQAKDQAPAEKEAATTVQLVVVRPMEAVHKSSWWLW